MSTNFMILPASAPERMRLLRVPDDYESHEAYRHVTALMAEVQESTPDWEWEDLAQVLEAQGFMPLDCVLGPALD